MHCYSLVTFVGKDKSLMLLFNFGRGLFCLVFWGFLCLLHGKLLAFFTFMDFVVCESTALVF